MLHLRLANYNNTYVKGNHRKKHRIPLKPTSYKYEMALHCYINGRHCIVEGVHWGLESMAYDMVCYVHLASGGSGSQDDGRGSSARVSNDKCVCCQPSQGRDPWSRVVHANEGYQTGPWSMRSPPYLYGLRLRRPF
ncbi:uncharacterized protein LOC119337343 [Triticum dicoccoides]|uniref:uncharacterized protein LOC119337343 n=1 Tax=Triticum dicoccoides TaxID=85692 RepID=UPI0018911499|nr:uncharacterized protein LOC119337343 [Triticum dicoccoides]